MTRVPRHFCVLDLRTQICAYHGTSLQSACEAYNPGTVLGTGVGPKDSYRSAMLLVDRFLRTEPSNAGIVGPDAAAEFA